MFARDQTDQLLCLFPRYSNWLFTIHSAASSVTTSLSVFYQRQFMFYMHISILFVFLLLCIELCAIFSLVCNKYVNKHPHQNNTQFWFHYFHIIYLHTCVVPNVHCTESERGDARSKWSASEQFFNVLWSILQCSVINTYSTLITYTYLEHTDHRLRAHWSHT